MDKPVKLALSSSTIEALTMLYLKQQDLKPLSPEEILELYNTTYSKISASQNEISTTQKASKVKFLKD